MKKLGNKCGHSPNHPKLTVLPSSNDKFPWLLKMAIDRVKSSYNNFSISLPMLDYNNRHRRSEARESIIQVLSFLLLHYEVASGRVVKTNNNRVVRISDNYIAKATGLETRRVQRALYSLRKANYIKTVAIKENKPAFRRIKVSVILRSISPTLFHDLGLSQLFASATKHAIKVIRRKKAKLLENKAISFYTQMRRKGVTNQTDDKAKSLTAIEIIKATLSKNNIKPCPT